MMRKWTLLLLACFALGLPAMAQRTCGFDKVHLKLRQNSAAYQQKVLDTKTKWVQLQQSINNGLVVTNNGDTIYQMPVVIHVAAFVAQVGCAELFPVIHRTFARASCFIPPPLSSSHSSCCESVATQVLNCMVDGRVHMLYSSDTNQLRARLP